MVGYWWVCPVSYHIVTGSVDQALFSPSTGSRNIPSPSLVELKESATPSEYKVLPGPSAKPSSDRSEGAEFDDDEFDEFDALLDGTVLMELDNVCSQDGPSQDGDSVMSESVMSESVMSEGRDDVIVLDDDDAHTPATDSPVAPSILGECCVQVLTIIITDCL